MEQDSWTESGVVWRLSVLALEAKEYTSLWGCCTERASLASSGHHCHTLGQLRARGSHHPHFSPREVMEE